MALDPTKIILSVGYGGEVAVTSGGADGDVREGCVQLRYKSVQDSRQVQLGAGLARHDCHLRILCTLDCGGRRRHSGLPAHGMLNTNVDVNSFYLPNYVCSRKLYHAFSCSNTEFYCTSCSL